jgi:hypothetical protein
MVLHRPVELAGLTRTWLIQRKDTRAAHLRQRLLASRYHDFLLWLASEGAGGATGSRFAANLWDAALRLEHAAEKSRTTEARDPAAS